MVFHLATFGTPSCPDKRGLAVLRWVQIFFWKSQQLLFELTLRVVTHVILCTVDEYQKKELISTFFNGFF